MNKQEILIAKKRMVLVSPGKGTASVRDGRVMTLQAEVMSLGFMLDEQLVNALSTLSDSRFEQLYRQVTGILTNLVGADVKYVPFYPNFPRQVMEASDVELFVNAIIHYWSLGTWRPQFEEATRLPAYEKINFKMLTLGTEADVASILSQILGANASVTTKDMEIVQFLMDTYTQGDLLAAVPERIPFKETLCTFVASCIERDMTTLGAEALKTATDILRVATHLSGGDVSLAANTRFKSLSRSVRRMLVTRLDSVVNDDDIFRHRSKWVTLAHNLHVGDFAKTAPRAFAAISRARSNDHKHLSFEGRVEAAIAGRKSTPIVELLSQRPGVFARRLDHVLRMFSARVASRVATSFLDVADKVDTRVLLQLFGHFKTRDRIVSERLVFPKGSTTKALLLKDELPALSAATVKKLSDGIQNVLEARFGELPTMGKVFIDPALEDCPVPLSLRSASEGLEVVGRGTRFALSDKGTLRMFIYWKGQDIDLSGSLYDEDLKLTSELAYTSLRDGKINSCHSGDIVHAPNGAAEFIDIDMASALASGARYVIMQVYVYSGPNFADHEVCYAGWMTRDKPNKNAIYDPKTVEQKVTLTSASKCAVPVVFDLETRQAIWMDVATPRTYGSLGGNNTHSNRASTVDILKGSLDLENKPTLYDLFIMHANARGTEFVEDINDADAVFSWTEGVKPTDTTEILSEYLA